MNRTMMDILACPNDKSYPLELFVIKEGKGEDGRVSEGALYCQECSRFYPIIDEIPIMLPDELRDREQEVGFLQEHKDNLPEKIIRSAGPWHL